MLDPEDRYIIAEEAGVLYGVVRLCLENDVLVLRGMRVSPEKRRQGVGTKLLRSLRSLIGEQECYCIPYRNLRSFYAQIGFMEIDPGEAPVFLRERLAANLDCLHLDVILMMLMPAKQVDLIS